MQARIQLRRSLAERAVESAKSQHDAELHAMTTQLQQAKCTIRYSQQTVRISCTAFHPVTVIC